MTLGAIVIGLFLIVYAALVVIALRRPLLGRLALREAVRRPGQSALIVLGLMVGTTAIYSMQLLVDSVVQSESQTAYTAWGRVDLVAADDGRFFDQSLATKLAADSRVKASTTGVQGGVELNGSVVDLDRNNEKPLVLLVGFDPAAQQPFGAYVLRDRRNTFGQDLAAGDVLISASLADALQAQIGDRLTVAAGPDQTAEMRVAGIAEATGPGAYGLRPAVFAPMISTRQLTGGPEINVIRIATGGDVRAEPARSHHAASAIRTALAALPDGPALRVREAKRDDIDAAIATANAAAGSIFGAFGLLVALAGVTLVVTLALALAEERRPLHAVLRALGLTRSSLIVLMVLEGGVYGAVAALLAPISGALLGLFIVKVVGRLLRTNQNAVWATQLQPAVEPGSVAVAVAIGGLITLGALFATSLRSSRMEISAAVKSLPEPPARRRRSAWWILALGAAGLVGAAMVAGNPPTRLAGGAVLILVGAAAARAWLSARLLATLAGAALATWVGVSAAAVPLDSNSGLLVLALGSPLAVFGLSLLLASNLRLLATAAGWLSGGMKATLTPSLAYLTRRPLRAGLGTGAFGLVLTLMAIITVFDHDPIITETLALDQYDLRVSAPTHPGLTLPDSVRSKIVREIAMPTRAYVGDLEIRINDSEQTHPADYIPLYALSRDQLLAAPFRLFAREARYRSDAEVWQALASDPGLVMSTGLALGAGVTLAGPNGPVHFRVAGIVATAALPGLVGSETGMAPFTTFPVGTTILAHTAPGADPRAVAREIQRDVFAQGGESIAIQDVLASLTAVNLALVNTLRLAVGLGLLVGVFSLGILALRAVIERRRSIGVLRALGYQPPNVLAGILVEVLLTATSGAVIGIGVGLVMGLLLLRSIAGSASVQVDSSPLAWTLALMYVAVLAVTLFPALRAARLAPSEALRGVD